MKGKGKRMRDERRGNKKKGIGDEGRIRDGELKREEEREVTREFITMQSVVHKIRMYIRVQ